MKKPLLFHSKNSRLHELMVYQYRLFLKEIYGFKRKLKDTSCGKNACECSLLEGLCHQKREVSRIFG